MDNISLTPMTEDDLEFLFQVYASTRLEEVAQTGWPIEQQESFLRMQFNAQHQHYQKYYPEASFEIILLAGEPVGRLYVSRWETQIRIVDIAILPKHRGKKIGSYLMSQLFLEAKENGMEISIHVEKNNPAMQWYLALGFVPIEDKSVYSLMKTRLHDECSNVSPHFY